MSAAPATKSSAERITFGTSTGLMSFSVRPPAARIARDIGSSARMAEYPMVTRLPRRSETIFMPESLRTQKPVLSV